MFLFRNRPISIMVMYAISLHVIWAGLLALDGSIIGTTAIAGINHYIVASYLVPFFGFRLPLLILSIAGTAVLASIGIYTQRPWVVLFLLPQQVLLMMSAAGAIESMWLSQYADGTFRPFPFIAADQINSVLAAIGHTIAIVAHARRVGA